MPAAMTTRRRESINEQHRFHQIFDKYDKDGDGEWSGVEWSDAIVCIYVCVCVCRGVDIIVFIVLVV